MSGSETHPVYADLGIQRVVNASDTLTMLGGGALSPRVREAMNAAASHHVAIVELLELVGRPIAALTHNPAAHVVAGAAAGLTVAAAAVMAGDDPGQIDALPGTPGARDQLVVLRCQRNPYDRALLAAGARLVEVGYADSTPLWQVEHAVNERTAGLVWYAGTQFERFAPTLEVMADVARSHGLPLVVDAAAQLPPVSNLWRYRERGADLVLLSGGKGLRGPQGSGLIVGAPALVAACARNSYPHHSVGRVAKTSKENVLGLLAAVEEAIAADESADYQRMEVVLEEIASTVHAMAGVTTEMLATGRLGQSYPRLLIRWQGHASAAEVAGALQRGTPCIEVGVEGPDGRCIVINPFPLQPGEPAVVAQRLAEVLGRLDG